MEKLYRCYINGNNEIEKVMSYGEYLWTILIFWFIPIYCIWMLFFKSCSRKDFFYTTREDYHKRKLKDLKLTKG